MSHLEQVRQTILKQIESEGIMTTQKAKQWVEDKMMELYILGQLDITKDPSLL